MIKLIPTKTQFKNWTLPSKFGYIAFVITVVAIVLMVIFFVIQLSAGASKEGQKKTHDKLETIDDKLSEAIDREKYKFLDKTLKSQILKSLQDINNKDMIISIRTTPGSRNKQLVGKDLEDFLKSAGFENTKYHSGTFQLFSSNTYPPILISCHPNAVMFSKRLTEALHPYLNAQFGIKKEEGVEEHKVQIAILYDPLFTANGSVIFEN